MITSNCFLSAFIFWEYVRHPLCQLRCQMPFEVSDTKKLQAGKPDSVVGYHLSAPMVTHRDQSAYPVPWASSPQSGTIRGISACKVYPQLMLPSKAVGSYPTFSPSPLPSPQVERVKQLFSVALSVSDKSEPPIFSGCIALCCPDFPTQLEALSR